TLNSLANAKDKAKRKTDAEIRAAINAAAATRHANNPGAGNNAESLAVEWTPEDFEAAFKGTSLTAASPPHLIASIYRNPPLISFMCKAHTLSFNSPPRFLTSNIIVPCQAS
ncbi:hypothetical protein CH063_03962, partial [Colletotrichum higginsianum]